MINNFYINLIIIFIGHFIFKSGIVVSYMENFTFIGARERSGSVVECLTRDRKAAGSSLTGVTALWSLSKTHLS